MSEYQRKLAGVWKRHDAHPLKSILPIMIQAPVFIGFFTSLRAMSEAKVLAILDPAFILCKHNALLCKLTKLKWHQGLDQRMHVSIARHTSGLCFLASMLMQHLTK